MSASLPAAEGQDWVIEELSSLLRTCGADRFVAGPLLQATPRYFPDPWSPDERGCEIMIGRLLSYAGLENLEVRVELFEEEVRHEHLEAPIVGNRWRRDGAAAWYEGREGNTVYFGIEWTQLEDPEVLVGTLAHEVAHVFREAHDLMVEGHDEEELLTDLTTIFLGFGVLTVNGSYRYRSSGDLNYTQWSVQRGGYLDPETLSFALAVQAVVRDLPARKVAALLETNQASYFKTASRVLEKDRAGLLQRLGIPAEAFAFSVQHSPAPLPPSDRPALPRAEGPPDVGTDPSGPVFRVKRSWALPLGFIGFLSWVIAIPMTAEKLGSEYLPWILIGLPVTGLLVGRGLSRDHCSDPDCAGPIAPMDRTCRTCGGEIRGTILRARDRLVAAEAHHAAAGERGAHAGTQAVITSAQSSSSPRTPSDPSRSGTRG